MNLSLRKAATLLVAGLAFAACSTESNDSPLTPPLGFASDGDDTTVRIRVCKQVLNEEGIGKQVSYLTNLPSGLTVLAGDGTNGTPVSNCESSGDFRSPTFTAPRAQMLDVIELTEAEGGTVEISSVVIRSFDNVVAVDESACLSPIADENGVGRAVTTSLECLPEAGEPYTLIFKNFYSVGEDGGFEGCTPGAWRNQDGSEMRNGRLRKDRWAALPDDYLGVPLSVNTLFEDIFGDIGDYDELTLRAALDFNDNSEGLALIKHATAAFLNAVHPDVDYPYAPDDVVDMFQNAWANPDGNETKDMFDSANNLGCPI